jgi:branched-chain amino acid aminotransferase
VPEPIAYLRGQWIPASQAAVPVYDAGFVLGATVTEQLRTFRGELFRLPEHLERLHASLELSGIEPQESLSDLADIAVRLVSQNFALVDSNDDLGLCIFMTPGPYAAMAEGDRSPPTVGLHTYRLPFHLWAEMYRAGAALRTTAIQQIPATSLSPALKCRSRMHYFIADRAAAKAQSGSRALLLDHRGHVSETSTANVVAYFPSEGLVSPPIEHVLPGISLQVLKELAGRLGIAFISREMTADEFAHAAEAFLTSTPNCLLPVTQFNGRPIGAGKPGDVFQQLLRAWNEMVEVDIASQAERFSRR